MTMTRVRDHLRSFLSEQKSLWLRPRLRRKSRRFLQKWRNLRRTKNVLFRLYYVRPHAVACRDMVVGGIEKSLLLKRLQQRHAKLSLDGKRGKRRRFHNPLHRRKRLWRVKRR